MDNLEIRMRLAGEADDDFINQLDAQTSWDTLSDTEKTSVSLDDLVARLSEINAPLRAAPDSRIYVAESGGSPAGFVWMSSRSNSITGLKEAWILLIAVSSDWRGRGVGRLLMEHAMGVARSEGYTCIGLMVSAQNASAIRLYEHHGFAVDQLIMRAPL